MLNAMLMAGVGDDVFGEDPAVNELEAVCAEMFNMQAALFCPSGTMTNQVAIKCHTQPGDEVICEKMSHVYIYEGGGIAFNSSCQVKAVGGDRGKISAEQIAASINPPDIQKANSRLVSVENTANRGGGSCYNFYDFEVIRVLCLQNNLKFHLDGARLWNALVANNENPKKYGDVFDSISICLSKGLGSPAGSVLLGDKEFIARARRVRKIFGGGMRQAGYLAAAGLYALENNIPRLAQDHQHAKQIAAALQKKDFVKTMMPVETNILIFEVEGRYNAAGLVEILKAENVLTIAISPTEVRMVTHLDITSEMVSKLVQFISAL